MSGGNVIGLIEKIVTSTPNTLRTVLAIVFVIVTVAFCLWVLKANLTAGPISVTGREPVDTGTAPCLPDTATRTVSVVCSR
ncbi:hypothetical protein [Amycolatopsis sp. NBC_01286]|uniref:hypothetical protein n=1 Tax=Amycolatopsis sp. NBC_01286 TaxID=2903560 RepID=UPI002E10BC53|nr:hypothetical protein OG570_17080 [Amycolatopsis sp. NBC_01286]